MVDGDTSATVEDLAARQIHGGTPRPRLRQYVLGRGDMVRRWALCAPVEVNRAEALAHSGRTAGGVVPSAATG